MARHIVQTENLQSRLGASRFWGFQYSVYPKPEDMGLIPQHPCRKLVEWHTFVVPVRRRGTGGSLRFTGRPVLSVKCQVQ